MKTWCVMITTALILLASANAMAQSATIPLAVEEASASANEALRGLVTLKSRGAGIAEVLLVEALPKGGVSAELGVEFRGFTLRYPIKLESLPPEEGCTNPTWRVTWTPDEAYTNALLNVITSGVLPAHDSTADHPEWASTPRMVALPLVVTREKIFTPYGKIAWSDLEQEVDPSSPGAEVMPPSALVQHGRRWINEYLEDEPGAAGVDLIVDARISWQTLNRLVFGVSSLGLYKIYIMLASSSNSLRALETAAPVFGSLPGVEKPVPLVIGYYPMRAASAGEPAHGWRVSQGKAVLSESDTCDKEMSFCTADVAGFSARFTEIVERMRAKKPENPSFAMFASTREVTLDEAVAFLQHAGTALGIPQRRVFIGYIKR